MGASSDTNFLKSQATSCQRRDSITIYGFTGDLSQGKLMKFTDMTFEYLGR